MNLAKAKLAEARNFGSGYLSWYKHTSMIAGANKAKRLLPVTNSFSQTLRMYSASASSASAPTTPISSSSLNCEPKLALAVLGDSVPKAETLLLLALVLATLIYQVRRKHELDTYIYIYIYTYMS